MKRYRGLIIGVGADLPMTVTCIKGGASILCEPLRCNLAPANATRDAIMAAPDD
jgi:hypothetical protein